MYWLSMRQMLANKTKYLMHFFAVSTQASAYESRLIICERSKLVGYLPIAMPSKGNLDKYSRLNNLVGLIYYVVIL